MEKNDVLETDLIYIWSSISNEPRGVLHCHSEYEIYYMIQGNVEYQIEGYRFTTAPGSLILIPPSVFHGMTTKTTDPYCRISIHFRPAFLDDAEQDSLLKMFKAEGVYYPDLVKTGIGFLVQSVFDCKKMEESLKKIALKSRIVSLLTHIYYLSSQKLTDSTIVDKRIQNILLYLNSNLQKSFSLGEIAREFRISKNYLNVLFHHGTGMTVNQYIRMKRLFKPGKAFLMDQRRKKPPGRRDLTIIQIFFGLINRISALCLPPVTKTGIQFIRIFSSKNRRGRRNYDLYTKCHYYNKPSKLRSTQRD